MIVSSKLTWGLAWTGLALILAVPSADYLTSQFGGRGAAAVVTSTTDPVTPAPSGGVTTTVTKTGVIITPAGKKPTSGADPVETYVSKNKALPDYLSDGESGQSADVKTQPSTSQVANVTPDAMAPVPFPARPADSVVRRPAPVAPSKLAPSATMTDPVMTETPEPIPLIVDEPSPQQAVAAGKPLPPASIVDDTASWRAPGLTQYLERNGLLSDGPTEQSQATVTESDQTYDPDGFYLSDGPNGTRDQRRARLLELFGDDPTAPVPPASFNLF